MDISTFLKKFDDKINNGQYNNDYKNYTLDVDKILSEIDTIHSDSFITRGSIYPQLEPQEKELSNVDHKELFKKTIEILKNSSEANS